jgi:hypothetical protein
MGDLVTILIEKGNIEDGLEFIIAVVPDIRGGTLWFQEMIPLLPDTDGVCLDPGQVLEILDCESIHTV